MNTDTNNSKPKVLLAIGTKYAKLVTSIKKQPYFKAHYTANDLTVLYRESLIDIINRERPDKVVVFDILPSQFQGEKGKEKDLSSLFYDLMMNPNIDNKDVVFVATKLKAGDEILDIIYSYGFYNILSGDITFDAMFSYLNKPRTAAEASKYKLIKKIADDKSRTLYQAPDGSKEKIVYVHDGEPAQQKEDDNTSKKDVLLSGQAGINQLNANKIEKGKDRDAAEVAQQINYKSDLPKDDLGKYQAGTIKSTIHQKKASKPAVEYRQEGWHYKVTKIS